MFKLLIADDEAGSREWLAQEIPWEAHDICVVGPAVDGTAAWAMFQAENPELILSDIRMPGMSGIELAQAALTLNPRVRVIVISGHDEFAYAKSCLELGVSGYILKPSPREEILAIILKERDLLLARQADEAERNLLQTQLQNSLPLLREQFLRELFRGEAEASNLNEKLRFLQLPEWVRFPVVVLNIEAENRTLFYRNFSEKERQLILLKTVHLVETALAETGFAVRIRGGVGALIFGEPDTEASELENLADRIARAILDQARSQLPCALKIGIGAGVEDISQVYNSFEKAQKAFRLQTQLGVETIASHSQWVPGESELLPLFLPNDEERLIISLETDQEGGAIHSILQPLFYQEPGIEPKRFEDAQQEMGWVLTGAIIRIAGRSGLLMREVITAEDYALLMQGGPDPRTGEPLRWWEIQFGNLGNAMRKLRNSSQRGCIRKVKEYVEGHLHENISLAQVSRAVYLSPSYLSRLFREQTNENFSEYITRRKMEEARRLLEQGDLKIYEVAAAVGYTDPAYFGRVFRQYYHVTPNDYRSS
ncbi:MAG TPA: helix-turn-helix domain-containing protein [Bacillota bacterium]|nr:helix-turn-helix domain-containing protein [Bacillota bacterium]